MSHHMSMNNNTSLMHLRKSCICVSHLRKISRFTTWRKIGHSCLPHQETRASLPHRLLQRLSWTVATSILLKRHSLLCLQARWLLRLLRYPLLTLYLEHQLHRNRYRHLQQLQQLIKRNRPQVSQQPQRCQSLYRRQLQPLSRTFHRRLSLRLHHRRRP